MEVHHHPKVEKKNFKEYFLEFVMIFLAVTLGFFAESLREHFADVRITHQYLEAYQQELEYNKETMHRYDSSYTSFMKETDSMTMLFHNRKENEDLNATSRLFTKSRAIVPTTLDDAAYQQLINSGGLKFIHNKALRDSMARYASAMKEFFVYNQIKYADRSANISEINSLDDIHDWTSSKKSLKWTLILN